MIVSLFLRTPYSELQLRAYGSNPVENQITIKIVCTMRNVTKSIPPKKCFFEMTKKLKIGRGWPKSARRVMNCFGTSQQNHLTPFHNKIMLRSSILKKISPTKRGVVISGQHGTRLLSMKLKSRCLLINRN